MADIISFNKVFVACVQCRCVHASQDFILFSIYLVDPQRAATGSSIRLGVVTSDEENTINPLLFNLVVTLFSFHFSQN